MVPALETSTASSGEGPKQAKEKQKKGNYAADEERRKLTSQKPGKLAIQSPSSSLGRKTTTLVPSPATPAMIARGLAKAPEGSWQGFHPDNNYYTWWSAVMLFPLLYTGFIMPYELSFYDFRVGDPLPPGKDSLWSPTVTLVLRLVIDIAFVADMVLSFFAGFYNVLGEAVTDLKTIRWHYTHSFFILDFIACIPPEMFSLLFKSSSDANKLTRLPRVSRLARMARLARLTRISKLLKIFRVFNELPAVKAALEVVGRTKATLIIIPLICGLCIISHICACLWYLITALSMDSDAHYWEDSDQQHWVDQNGLTDKPPYDHWLYSLYFVYTVFTTVGFGDILAKGNTQLAFVTFLMILGTVINSVVITEVIGVVSRHDHVQVQVAAQRRCVRSFAVATGLPSEGLYARLAHWAEYHTRRMYLPDQADATHGDSFSARERLQFQHLVWSMPKELLLEIESEVFGGEFARSQFVHHCNVKHDAVKVLVSSQLRPTREYRAGEFVYEPGAMPTGIYFIFGGLAAQVAVATPTGGVTNIKMRVGGDAAEEFQFSPYYLFGRLSYFGEWEVIFPHPRLSGVRAEWPLHAYMLPRSSFVDIANEVPQLLEHFRRKAARREQRRLFRLRYHTMAGTNSVEDTAAMFIQRAHRYRMAKKHARMASKKLKTMFRMGKLRNAKEVVAPMDGERELIRNVTKIQAMFRRKQAVGEVETRQAEREQANAVAAREAQSQKFVNSMANWWTCNTPAGAGQDGPAEIVDLAELNVDSNQSNGSKASASDSKTSSPADGKRQAAPSASGKKAGAPALLAKKMSERGLAAKARSKAKEDAKKEQRLERQMQAVQGAMQEMRTMLQQIYLLSSQSQSLAELTYSE